MTESDLPMRLKKPPIDPVLLHVEALLNLIPLVGGTLGTYFGEIRGKKVEERTAAFISYFGEQLAALDNAKLDRAYLGSEEFAEDFKRGLDEAARSTHSARAERFANVLLNNALGDLSARERTANVFALVDRLSEFDSFVLLAFGPPYRPSLRAESRAEALGLVRILADFLNVQLPEEDGIVDSLIFMDNLGVTWVTQSEMARLGPAGTLPVREFSVFRSPLGDLLAGAISPPGFYLPMDKLRSEGEWPQDIVDPRFRRHS